MVELAAHAKSSTLYDQSYSHMVIHPNLFGLMGYHYFVQLWGYISSTIYLQQLQKQPFSTLWRMVRLPLHASNYLGTAAV